MYSMSVISLSNTDKTQEIYEKYKKYIPDELKEKSDYQYDKEKGKIDIPISRNSPEYSRLKEQALANHISVYEYEFSEYSKQEMKDAEFFQMIVSDPLESEGTYARDYGTKYVDCCDACKVGGTLYGDVFVDRKFVKKCSIASLRPDIFVSAEVKWLIEENGLTGVSFEHKVLDYKGREIPDYYVMTFENVLKPMNTQTWFSFEPVAKKCPACGKKIPYLKSHFYYNGEDLKNIRDFNLTMEAYDNFSERGIVVSKKVKEIFSKAKVRVGYRMLNIV